MHRAGIIAIPGSAGGLAEVHDRHIPPAAISGPSTVSCRSAPPGPGAGPGTICRTVPDGGCAARLGRWLGVADCEPASVRRRRILVLALGGIGDTVLSFAAWRDLRWACPDDHLTALAMWPQSAELLEDLGIFDEVQWHNFQRDRGWRSLVRTLRLRAGHYDVSLLAFPANRFEYNALAFLLGARERWGHSYVRGGDVANLRFLLTDRIDQRLGRHVIDENRALIAAFTGIQPEGPPEIRLGPLHPRYHHRAARLLAHLDRPLLGIHAGSSSYKGLAAKRWPAESFGRLCHQAHRHLGLQPVVFGAIDEIDVKLRIQALCPEVFFAHGESIRQTAALIGKCAAFVSNDSGLAHIAAAMDVPVVMVCGPTDPSEVRPYPDSGHVIHAGLGCSPCFRVGRRPMACTHRTYQACMKRITVGQVLGAVSSCLHLPREIPANHAETVEPQPNLERQNLDRQPVSAGLA
jgi:ADP-heptose:LPS heptosyltransferase